MKRERVINKTLFQMKFYYPPEYDKPIKIFQPGLLVTFFRGKISGIVHFMSLLLLLFTLASCDYAKFSLVLVLRILYGQK